MSKISRMILLGGAALVLVIVVVNLWLSGPEVTLYATTLLEARVQRDAFFRTQQSPLPQQTRFAHGELPYYPADEDYVVTATFRRVAEAPIDTQQPSERPLPRAGILSFTLKGHKAELSAYFLQPDRYDKLFVPFRDETSDKTTYGGGRYLYPVLEADEKTVKLDFNRAVNPNCAYNHDYVCPLPPPENRLKFSVEAGEKKYPNAR